MGRAAYFREGFYPFTGSHLLLTAFFFLHVYLQILTNPNHHFVDSSLYKDVILVAWDPAPYSANLNVVRCLLVPFFPASPKILGKICLFSTPVFLFLTYHSEPQSHSLRSRVHYLCMSWSK